MKGFSGPPRQVDRRQRVRGRHVWPCPLDSPNGKLGLAQVVPTGCQGIPKSLPDDVFKVRVHTVMRAQPAAKEKPRHRGTGARPSQDTHQRPALGRGRAKKPRAS